MMPKLVAYISILLTVLISLCNSLSMGKKCQENCLNANHQSGCGNVSCLSGCREGWYGPWCNKRCNPHCLHSVCDQTDGSCTQGCKYSPLGQYRYRKCKGKLVKRSIENCIKHDSQNQSLCACCKDNYRGEDCMIFCENCFSFEHNEECKYMCKGGYYGYTCNNTCPVTCAKGNTGAPVCKEITPGVIQCSNGCYKGYYGEMCDMPCSKSCKNSICYQFTGTCFGCPDTFYGNNCDLSCNSECIDGKCHINGSCIKGCKNGECGNLCPLNCAPGQTSSPPCMFSNTDDVRCAFGCRAGYRGLTCEERCMDNCKNCSQTSGECLLCEKTWYGEMCERKCSKGCQDGMCVRNGTCFNCVSGFYGDHCTYKCGANCRRSKCEALSMGKTKTFTCSDGCEDGYWGNRCEEECPTNCPNCSNVINNQCVTLLEISDGERSEVNVVAVTVPLTIIVIVVVVVSVFLFKCKKKWFTSRCGQSGGMSKRTQRQLQRQYGNDPDNKEQSCSLKGDSENHKDPDNKEQSCSLKDPDNKEQSCSLKGDSEHHKGSDIERVKSFRRFQNYFRNYFSSNSRNVQKILQMPELKKDQQPTIAIISTLQTEKDAVDAMIDNSITYMIDKGQGESVAYTVGDIGDHKVLSTKLVFIKQQQGSPIPSGNFTTQLLGKFTEIQHVFIVGVGGGVVKTASDYEQVQLSDVAANSCNIAHSLTPQLGDVIISCSEDVLYYYSGESEDQDYRDEDIQKWSPKDTVLQSIAKKLHEATESNPCYAPWIQYIEEGQEQPQLKNQRARFTRPIQEISNSSEKEDNDFEILQISDCKSSRLHFGAFASGSVVSEDESKKLEFATKYGISCFDTGSQGLLDSICGNAKESFMLVRGIADFKDGSQEKEWGPYASLAAAAAVKTIIKSLNAPKLDGL